jgi:hypothetical protein
MFTHMDSVRTEVHATHQAKYELAVYRIVETGEYRVYISKGDQGLGLLASASAEIVSDGRTGGVDIVEALVQAARDEIDRNEWGKY